MSTPDEAPTRARARTRRAVLAAARQVFAQRGFHGASMQAIAEEAGYTQGAIYANFGGKTELFLAVVDARLDEHETELAAALGRDDGEPRLDRSREVGRAHLAASDREHEVLLGLEFLLYVVRDTPERRPELAQRFLAADAATRRALVASLPPDAAVSDEAADELTLVHSLLVEGLAVRLLADPDLLSVDEAAYLIERTVTAAASALRQRP